MSLTFLSGLDLAASNELADGFGDARALETLGNERYSLTLARLELLRRQAMEYVSDQYLATGMDAAWALLAAADRADQDSLRTVLSVPAVGGWIGQSLTAIVNRQGRAIVQRHLGHSRAIAVAAAIRAEIEFECAVPASDGVVVLPGVGALVTADPRAHNAVLRCQRGRLWLDGAPVERPGGAGWLMFRELTATHDGLTIRVLLDDLDPYRSADGLTPAGRLADAAVVVLQGLLAEAWSILVARHRRYAEGIAAALRSFVLLDGYPANRGVSAAFRDAHGSICMTLPSDSTAFAVTLLHETQHVKLNGVLERVDLHAGPRERLFRAPWRDDPRPLEGLMQGAYAFAGVIDFWRTERAVLSGSAWTVAEFEFARWRVGVTEVLTTIVESEDVTAAGAYFFARLRERVRPWLDEKVSDDVRAIADQAMLDDEVCWRLRNHQVDAELVADLAGLYLAGSPAPAASRVFMTTVGAARREDHSRQDLVRLSLIDPDRFDRVRSDPLVLGSEVPDASPADVAYAAGSEDAEMLYREAVKRAPEQIESWAGLAMSLSRRGQTELLEHIEVAYAISQKVGREGGEVDPDDVAAWLSGRRW